MVWEKRRKKPNKKLRMTRSTRGTMILKTLYENYDLAIERILIKEYKRLDLSMAERSILLALFSIYKKRKSFSIAAISRRVDYSQNEIGDIVEGLLDKGFMTMEIERTKGQKEREVFCLDPTFKKIEELLIEDEKKERQALYENRISQTIKQFEQGLGRLLRPYELETIRRWYDEGLYTSDQIDRALEQAEDKVSIKYVERLLSQQIPKPIEIDEKVDRALDDLYKKIG
jgi:DNA replication protein